MIRAVTFACYFAATLPAAAKDPIFGLPVECVLGESCYIQNYMDADPGPGAADYTCGSLSYDGHKGTDFATMPPAQFLVGVHVLAAAPGRVIGTRDGEPDVLKSTDALKNAVEGRECGNGVTIDHGAGWVTQYCHLRQGSVAVRAGQRVAMGTVLGQIGLSGLTEFPHLHLSIRQDGTPVDPLNPSGITTCSGPLDDQLWAQEIPYQPGGIIHNGFGTHVPNPTQQKSTLTPLETLPVDSEALVFWGQFYGLQTGDRITLAIRGPKEFTADHAYVATRNQAQYFLYAGRKLRDDSRQPGIYQGTAKLIRNGVVIAQSATHVTLQDN